MFIADMPNGMYHEIIFHEGPNLTDPVVVFVKTAGKFNADFEITLPSLPSAGLIGGVEILRHSGTRKEKFWFGMQVGEGEHRHIERFEWRRSHGVEVKNVGAGKWGWKLVRLGSRSPEDEVSEDIQDVHVKEDSDGDGKEDGKKDLKRTATGSSRREGFTSDGLEIVAVWAEHTGMSMTKIGEFQLRGSGKTGELGRSWGLMALVSFVCISVKETQRKTQSSSA